MPPTSRDRRMKDHPPARASTPGSSPTPYGQLTPMAVLQAMDAVDLPADGRLLQLNSYENRVFQVGLDDGRFSVVKFYRPGRWTDAQILEEHSFAAELVAEEIPVMAPWALAAAPGHTLQVHGEPPTLAEGRLGDAATGHTGDLFRFSVTPRRAGRAPELEDPETLAWIGRFLGRLHRVGARQTFAHRQALTPATLGWASREWLLSEGVLPPDAEPAWAQVTQAALEQVDEAFDRVRPTSLRLHGDCHAGNLLWTPDGPHFVDLDDAMTGPAMQDLWMLLPGELDAARQPLRHLLRGYEDFHDFNDAELALIEPLRTLRLIHHSAWLARRWQDPAFPIAFPWFGSSSYWAQQTTQLREQLAAM